MNFLQGYDSSDDDEKDNNTEKTVSNDINEDVNDDNDNDNDDGGERGRLERATRKRIKLRNDTAELPDEFFVAKPGENRAEESQAPIRPPVVSAPPTRSLIPPQLARRRANKSTEDDAVQYGSSSKTTKK